MAIAASAVARVLGIETNYVDLRKGGSAILPQGLAVIAQGKEGVSYSSTKRQITSQNEAGNVYGFGSPMHLAFCELFPLNGDGIGTVRCTAYPLQAHASGVVAAGAIVPSGTTTRQDSYRLRIAGVLSDSFNIAAGAVTGVSLYNALRGMRTAIINILGMSVTATHTYGTITAGAIVGTGNGTITSLALGTTPKPGVWNLFVNTAVANGGVWTLQDPDGVVISSTLTMTPGVGVATVFTDVGGITFTLTDGTTDFGLGASFAITVQATNLIVTANWKGASGNDIVIEVIQPAASTGAVFTITNMSGGLNDPSVALALAQIGTVWETVVLNPFNVSNSVALDAIKDFGEGRWGDLQHKPLFAVVGNTIADRALACAVSDNRKTDRINGQLVAPGSPNLPLVVAARELARLVAVADSKPANDYGSQRATRLVPGLDSLQWDYPTKDAAVKAGSSTIDVVDGVVSLSDSVTFYHPTGDSLPAYRFMCDLIKLQNIIFNTNLLFATPDWDGAPLVGDNQATTNPDAKKPKSAKSKIMGMIDGLALAAIIADPETSKKSITSVIDPNNPKRLNISFTVALAGNTNIKSVVLNFGFYFGG